MCSGYTNMKASIENTGEMGRIYAGKWFRRDLSNHQNLHAWWSLTLSMIGKQNAAAIKGYNPRQWLHCLEHWEEWRLIPQTILSCLWLLRSNNSCIKEGSFGLRLGCLEKILVDEQTCKMQGCSWYKTRLGKFKRLGNGLQTDCITDDGCTYNFYFQNEPVPKKWMLKGMCPMHCCLLHIFEHFPHVGHYCNMENLFMRVGLAQEAYLLQTRVLIQGVIWKSNCGVLTCVIQDKKTVKAAGRVQGTVKASVLKNCGKSCDLIIASCYNQKPFCMLSHSIKEITWIEYETKAYSQALKKAIIFKFLQSNLSHNFNFEMNDNNVADPLRLIYCFMRFQQKITWWWTGDGSLACWCIHDVMQESETYLISWLLQMEVSLQFLSIAGIMSSGSPNKVWSLKIVLQ